MAACLITVSGTSGEVRVDYMSGATPKHVISEIGAFYLEDTYTSLTYTTLYGDAIATSGCFTITNSPLTCYHFKWDYSAIQNYNFVELEIDGVVSSLTPNTFSNQSPDELAAAINSLLDDNIKAVQAQVNNATRPNFILVVKVMAINPPKLKVSNSIDSASFYIEGEVGTCSNVGFYDYNTCQPIILP